MGHEILTVAFISSTLVLLGSILGFVLLKIQGE